MKKYFWVDMRFNKIGPYPTYLAALAEEFPPMMPPSALLALLPPRVLVSAVFMSAGFLKRSPQPGAGQVTSWERSSSRYRHRSFRSAFSLRRSLCLQQEG